MRIRNIETRPGFTPGMYRAHARAVRRLADAFRRDATELRSATLLRQSRIFLAGALRAECAAECAERGAR